MKKNNILKIVLIAVGSISFIISLILFIKSFTKYDDGYGIDYSFDYNFVIFLIISLIITGAAIYSLINGKEKLCYTSALVISSTIISFYSLGTFFKSMFKAIKKGTELTFNPHYLNLIIGLMALMILLISLLYLFKLLKNKDE